MNTQLATDNIELIIFYKGGLPRALDTKENWLGGKWNDVYPKWWDGFIFKPVPRKEWELGNVKVENIVKYLN